MRNDKNTALAITTTLAKAGYTSSDIATVVKALPSTPIWTQLTMDFGFWDANREELMTLLACYQKNPIVHGAIDINAKGITAAKPCLMKLVNKGAKHLSSRGLRRLSHKRLKRIQKQWAEPNLCRKSLGDDAELVEVTDHPLLDALHSPDQDQNFHSLLRLLAINVCIFGTAFLAKIRDNIGNVTSYLYLPTYNVTPERGADGRVIGWFYCSTYGDSFDLKTPIDKEDMVVVRWPSLSDPHAGGDSPLKSALKKLELSGKWVDFQTWLLNNRARPDGVLTVDDEAGSDITGREEKRFNDKFRGPGNGGVLITSGKFTSISYSPTDLAPLQFDQELKSCILFALGIPESFTTNDSNKATMAASMDQWARQSLAPMVALIESALNNLAKEYDPTLIWVFENVIPEDRAQELLEETFELTKWQAALTAGAVTDDEFREVVLGLGPMPEADKPQPAPVPPQLQTIEQQVEAEPLEEGVENAEEVESDKPAKALNLLALNTKVAKGIVDRATAINLVAYSLQFSQEEARNLVTHPKTKGTKGKKLAPPKINKTAVKLLAGEVRRCMDKHEQHYMNQVTGNHVENKKALAADGLPKKFLQDDDFDSIDGNLYSPYLHMAAKQTADSRTDLLTRVGAEEGDFSVVPQNIAEASKNISMKFAESTNATTSKRLNDALEETRSQLAEGILQGEPAQILKGRVKSIFEEMDDTKAEQIARTEISRATHEAQRITAKASGIVKGFQLLASSECCDECNEINGKLIHLDGKFNSEDDYDDSCLPIHPNCRCTMLEQIDYDALGKDD